jgi:hypothetical protein
MRYPILGSCCSTIELHPRAGRRHLPQREDKVNARKRIARSGVELAD